MVFVSPGTCYGICLEICHIGKYIKIMVSISLCQAHLLEVDLTKYSERAWNLMHSLPCGTPCRLFLHEVFFQYLDLHLRVWSKLGRSPSFRPMKALWWQWSWAFSLMCEVALSDAEVKGSPPPVDSHLDGDTLHSELALSKVYIV